MPKLRIRPLTNQSRISSAFEVEFVSHDVSRCSKNIPMNYTMHGHPNQSVTVYKTCLSGLAYMNTATHPI